MFKEWWQETVKPAMVRVGKWCQEKIIKPVVAWFRGEQQEIVKPAVVAQPQSKTIAESAHAIVQPLVVPHTQRKTLHECATQDEQDATLVKNKLDYYAQRLVPIVQQLETFTGKKFEITYARNYKQGGAKDGGIIEIDYPTLNKSQEELVCTIAHEWFHHDLGHLHNKYTNKPMAISITEAEHSADFCAGIFLGYHRYNLQKTLKPKLHMPEIGHTHGTRVDRARIITKGYLIGQEMLAGRVPVGFAPAYEFYKKQHKGQSPWQIKGPSAYSEAVLSKLRNPSR